MKPFINVILFLVIALTFVAGQAQSKAVPSASLISVLQINRGFVDANGVMIYYEEFGKGSPLVIVHGGPGASHDYFLPYLAPLARHNRLIFIDERGSGQSERLEDSTQYTVENMVEDVEAVRISLGIGKIALLGHSFGGVLAQAYPLRYQAHLSHLILCSTFSSTTQMNEVLTKMKNKMWANSGTGLIKRKRKDCTVTERLTSRTDMSPNT